MNNLLKKVKDMTSEVCVSLILNTHRTKPDNQKDPITLKNLIKEAEDRLHNDYDKRFVWKIMEHLNKLTDSIDHNYNLESMVIFANEDFADFTRLPVKVTDRVVLDETFATRDLVRAMHQETNYYVLVLSRQNARLIEAHNDQVIEEKQGAFPIANKLYTTDRDKLSRAAGQDNLIEEFFNRVDKTLHETAKDHPLPIILATETRNFDHFMKVTDKKDLVLGHINKNRDDEQAHHIVADAYKTVLQLVKERNDARIGELKQAVANGKFVSDYNDIWKSIQEGRGKTLFVKKGFFQPAILDQDEILLVEKLEKDQKGVVDDILDEMIEQNLSFGGDTVFLEGDELDKFENVALITRY
jgi:hypothetical protein